MFGQRSHLVAVNVTGFVAMDTWPFLRPKIKSDSLQFRSRLRVNKKNGANL